MDVLALPKQRGGFAVPLKDPELLNMAAILNRIEKADSFPPVRDFHYYDQHSWLSPEYNAFRASTFLEALEKDPPPDWVGRDGGYNEITSAK